MVHDRRLHPPMVGPFHALLLAFPVALFPAALVSDIAYLNTAEMQWSNFAAWLLAGAELFAGLVLIAAIFALWRAARKARALMYFIITLSLFVVGLVNSFQHSRDAWSSVGTLGLWLSIAGTVLALAAGLIGYASRTATIVPDETELRQ